MTSSPGDENVNYSLLRAASPTCLTALFDVEIESKCHHQPNTVHNRCPNSQVPAIFILSPLQGASEMHIKQTSDHLPSSLLLALVRWGKLCRHPSELCGLLFSTGHYVKNKEHDHRQHPEPGDSPAIFSKHEYR